MSSRQLARTGQAHSVEVQQVYERVLAGASVASRFIQVGAGDVVHLLEGGAGSPVVLLHGTGNSAGFLLPLLNELQGVRAIAPDLPGIGLSDPIDLPRDRYRETAVAWLDRLLDALELDSTALVGHSGGGLWALWYALAHPDRVTRLVLLAPPALPKTRCPLPIRLLSTPGLGELLSRLAPPSPKSVLQLARVHGRAGDPHRSPGSGRPAGGRGPGLGRRRGRQSRVPGVGLAIRLAVAFRVPAPCHACGPTSCAKWPCPRWWSGASGTRSAAFRSPRR